WPPDFPRKISANCGKGRDGRDTRDCRLGTKVGAVVCLTCNGCVHYPGRYNSCSAISASAPAPVPQWCRGFSCYDAGHELIQLCQSSCSSCHCRAKSTQARAITLVGT